MIEAEVHYSLHNFLRSQGQDPSWPHHLTMARLVARALRLGRSALIQVGAGVGYQGRYRLSYLAPALIWPEPVIVVATKEVQQRLSRVEIPPIQRWLQTNKGIHSGDRWPHPDFRGLLMTSPQAWLSAGLEGREDFPKNIPTILDGVDDLEDWTRQELTTCIEPSDWDELMLAYPTHVEMIRDARVQLTRAIFQHPPNPYECYLISQQEQEILSNLYKTLGAMNGQESLANLPDVWKKFEFFPTNEKLLWVTVNRSSGVFSLLRAPVDVASALLPIWSKQPVVLIGSALDREAEAPIYRQSIGLKDATCLKFSADRHNELIQLYLPDGLPLPNTPEFQTALMEKLHALLGASAMAPGLRVVLVGDVPLKAQVGAILAAEFGSRVQVEKTCLDDNGILVSGWEFWRQHQNVLPNPQLIVVATLPLPSLEDPLVAGRVAYYKRSHQDWFRLYLLPTALNQLQRAIAPLRDSQGVVALLDSRVLHRSYGSQVLAALDPSARINYLDPSLFAPSSTNQS